MPISQQDLLSIIFTFIVGFAGGVYLFLTGFAPFANELADIELSPTAQIEVVSEVYGGCRDACPSYQVLGNGNYRYLYTPRAGAESVIRQGTLPRNLQRQLKAALDLEAIIAQSEEVTPLVCNSYTDGIDIDYFITIDRDEYVLSSCGTAVDPNSELWLILDSIWAYFESLGNNF